MASRVAFGRAAISAAVLVSGSLVSVVASANAVAAAGTLVMSPKSPIVGEHVTAKGRLGTHVARPIVLQLKMASSWATRARGRSSTNGAFGLTVRAASSPGRATYRVLAPKVRVNGHTYPTIRTLSSTVHSVRQTAVLSVPTTDLVGSQATASATFTPARPGRTVQLQRQVSGSWTTIVTGRENSSGVAAMAFTPAAAGPYTLRALATPVNGAAPAASADSTTTVTTPSPWLQLNTDSGVYCGVKTDHTGWCWGDNGNGSVGDPIQNEYTQPVQIPGSWESISTNDLTTCGLQTDGTAWCWGANLSGQVGNGDSTGTLVSRPYELSGTWNSLYNFGGVNCGIRPDDTAWCWGSNYHGLMGIGDTTHAQIYTPQQLPGHWSELNVGSALAVMCGVQTDGSGWCWGDDSTDAVGDTAAQDGTAPPVYSPAQLSGTGWTHIITSGLTSCGVRNDATGWCWGALPGNGSDGTNTPTQLRGAWNSFSAAGTTQTAAVGAQENLCGVQTDHTGWCWGGNDLGQLENGSTTPYGTRVKSPVQVPGVWSTLRTNSEMTCGVKTNHTAACWGYNEHGQVGNGTSGFGNLVLTPATLPGTWSSISGLTDGGNTCGIELEATGWCWGWHAGVVQTSPVELP